MKFRWRQHDDGLPVSLCEEFYVISPIVSGITNSNNAAATRATANQNNQLLQNQFNTNQSNQSSYMATGQNASDDLTDQLQSLTTPISLSESAVQQTPGYQFNLSQGLKSTQNSAAARGLASSGAALKGAATYATGLADSTYQNQFNDANVNQTNTYNRLLGTAQLGSNAASNVANANNTVTQAQVNNNTGATNSINSDNTATANAITGAVSNVTSGLLYNNLYGGSSYSGLYGSGGIGRN